MRSHPWAIGAFAVLCACGRIGFGFEAPDATTDAATDPVPDVGSPDAMVCTGPFSAPSPIQSTVSNANEWGGTIDRDGLELYFVSNRGPNGDYDIYRATRATRTDPFGAPALVTELSTSTSEDDPFLTADGLELWFNRSGQILRSTRVDRSSPWQAPQPVASLDASGSEISTMLRDDLLVVYFASDRTPSAGNFDLYMATRPSVADPFGPAVSLTALNTSSFDCCPQLVEGGSRLIYMTSATGEDKLMSVALDANGLPTGPISAVHDEDGDETDPFESADGTLRGYAHRPTTQGHYDLYLMERACP